MEQYTRLSKTGMEAILVEFDIHHLSSFKILSGGSENTNYLIISEKGKYVLSICEQKSLQKTKELASLLGTRNK